MRVSPVQRGAFMHANPPDLIHWGKGKVSACDRTTFLEFRFRGLPHPKFRVSLGSKPNAWRET